MPIATQNPLFIQGYEGAIGVKTGWTTEAGKTFVGAAERGDTSLVVTMLNIEGDIYPSASALLDWGFANVDAVTPVGYLVDPIDEVIPSAIEEGSDASGAAPGTTTDSEEAAPSTAAAATSTPESSTPWGWVWTLVGAMVVGLLLIVLGLRSLRGPAPRSGGRRARTQSPEEADIERDYARS
jgi:D-alanyl-D-alanine carboxypeptidase (penicillin-binding protein 5/6)